MVEKKWFGIYDNLQAVKVLLESSVHISLRNQTNKKSLYLKSDCSECVSEWCEYLATGLLALQVQLPVLRPHLRRGITTYYSSTNNSLLPTNLQAASDKQLRCERCYISTWMCEQQTADLLSVTDTLPGKLVCPL